MAIACACLSRHWQLRWIRRRIFSPAEHRCPWYATK